MQIQVFLEREVLMKRCSFTVLGKTEGCLAKGALGKTEGRLAKQRGMYVYNIYIYIYD